MPSDCHVTVICYPMFSKLENFKVNEKCFLLNVILSVNTILIETVNKKRYV